MLPSNHIIIGLTGPAGAGKDTAADRLCHAHNFERHAFAEPIRDMLTAFLVGSGIDYSHLFKRELKEQPIAGLGDVSGRVLMQSLGDWGRELHTDFWVRAAAMHMGTHNLPHSAPIHDRIVLTDVRFANEAEWIERMGGRVIRIERDTCPVAEHASERYHSLIPAFATINNNGSLARLHDQVDELALLLTAPQETKQ